jgi:haloalkane dehalogenase
MRRLLDDEPVQREITQYHLPMFSLGGFTGLAGVHVRFPMILVSLGCPNACDFCNTSAFFKHKKIYVAEPEQVYRYIQNYQRRMKFREIIVMLWDEDFFLNPDYVRELGRLLRSRKSTWCVRYYAFGSIRSLSQFSPEEIRDNGCQMVWIGVESFQCGAERTDDRKQTRQGKQIQEVFAGLRRHGVQPTGSLVLGLDFHTRENLKDDVDRFVELKPMFYQVSHMLPCPGTALYDRLLEEGRIREGYRWEDLHFWSDHVLQYQNCTQADIQEAFQYAHDRLRDVNGPPTLQMLESVLDSYQLLKDDPDPFRQALAKRDRLIAAGFFSFLPSIQKHHPSAQVRERARTLEARLRREVGPPSMITRALARYISHNIKQKTQSPARPAVSDPPARWTYYHTYGEEVWVKKGREAKKPTPLKDDSFLAGVGLASLSRLIGQGKKGMKFLDRL